MAFCRYLTWSSVVSAVLAAPPLLNQAQAGGTQRPVGTSFGVPGSSSKFDYVVSLFFSLFCCYLTKKIIGGGTAGLTVAERLSEDPSISVAVIEAGGFYELDNGNVSQIPAFYAKNFNQTAAPETIQPLIDWGYIIEPQVVGEAKLCTNNANSYRAWEIVDFITLRAKRSAEGTETIIDRE